MVGEEKALFPADTIRIANHGLVDGAQIVYDSRGGTSIGGLTSGRDYNVLVVDDSTQRAQGVLIYESQRPPPGFPQLGTVSGGDKTIPLYGVRVDWPSVNNPRCPLLGAPAPAPR